MHSAMESIIVEHMRRNCEMVAFAELTNVNLKLLMKIWLTGPGHGGHTGSLSNDTRGDFVSKEPHGLL